MIEAPRPLLNFEGERPTEKELYNHEEKIGDNLFIKTHETGSFVEVWLEKDGKIIANLRDFIPKFAQIRVDRFPDKEDLIKKEGSSSYNQVKNELTAGYWEGPKTLLSLLHEAGHSNEPLKYPEIRSFLRIMLDTASPFSHFTKEKVEEAAKYLAEASESERNAWAFALRSIRKIEKDNNVEILFGENMFKNVQEVKEYINENLSSYREFSQNLARLIKHYKIFIKRPFSWVDDLANDLFDKPKK